MSADNGKRMIRISVSISEDDAAELAADVAIRGTGFLRIVAPAIAHRVASERITVAPAKDNQP